MLAGVVMVLGMADYYRVDRFILHPERFSTTTRTASCTTGGNHALSTADEMVNVLCDRKSRLPDPSRWTARSDRFPRCSGSNRFMVFGIESIGGYHPAKLSWPTSST